MLTLLNLFGAVALLIWGTHMVQTGILRAWGVPLRRWLGHSVNHKGTAFLSGLTMTALIQSGTATTLMMSAFVAQGLIQTHAAMAVVLGADVGSSLIAQAFSLRITWISPLLIFIGVALFRADRTTTSRNAGRAAIGLGLMMLALQLIGHTMLPISHSPIIQQIFKTLTGDLLLDMALAALLTLLAHSSLAIVLLIVSLVGSESISPGLGFALVLGANLGSAMTPMLSSSGTGNAARRVPLANLIFKLSACVLVMPFLRYLPEWLALLDDDPARQMLHFHTLFNLATAVLFIGLTGPVAKLTERILPNSASSDDPAQPRYLDPNVINTPEVAVSCAAREALRIGDLIDQMLRHSQQVLCQNEEKLVRPVEQMESGVDSLYKAIKFYLMQVNREELSTVENQRWADIISLTINLEHIGDIIDKNLMDLARRKIRGQLSFSESGNEEIRELHDRLINNLRLGLNLFMHPDVKNAQRLLEEKSRFNELERLYAENHLQRLTSNMLPSVETSALHLDVIRDLRRINSHVCALAYPILDAAGMLTKNRLRQQNLEPEVASPAKSRRRSLKGST